LTRSRRRSLRRARLELDHTELCAVLLAIDRAQACACTDAFGSTVRAELERARAVIAAALVRAATNGRVRVWARARQRRAP
jgi:hypothetical protein